MTGKHTRIASGQRWYREALGIHVGDLLTRGSPPEPFEVWSISAPRMVSVVPGVLVIRLWPVVDVSLVRAGQEPEWERAYPFHGFSAIRREDTRWRDDFQQEYHFSPPAAPHPFAVHPTWSFPPLPTPYAFQPGIDYRAGWPRSGTAPSACCGTGTI
jgi:hypothetical protein